MPEGKYCFGVFLLQTYTLIIYCTLSKRKEHQTDEINIRLDSKTSYS